MSILVVASHPDDEVLGCGGTISKLTQAGEAVSLLLLGRGVASRNMSIDEIRTALKAMMKCTDDAAKVLGVKDYRVSDFPDNKCDTVALLDIIKLIEHYVQKWQPHTVFTHWHGDLNVDHQAANRAVLTACRPPSSVKAIYAFEVLSSSEWNYPQRFNSNYYVDITDTLDAKIHAMECYPTELREAPHSRSRAGIQALAAHRGTQVGVKYAEAFEVVRRVE